MKKLTKLLSVFVISGAVGTSVVAAACNSHTHSYTYEDNGNGTHTATCVDGDDTIPDQLHVDGDSDNKCDNCGATINEQGTTPVVEDKVTGVSISGGNEVAVKGTLTLTATVTVTGNAAKTVTWSSSDESKATVANGVVTGVAEGEVTITATSTVDNTKKAELKITVLAEGTTPVVKTPTYADLIGREDVRVKIDTEAEVGTLLTESDGVTPGIYVRGSKDGYESEATISYADDNGTKVIKQNHADEKGTVNVYTIVNPGPVKGEVEGVFTTKVSHLGSNGDFIVLNGNVSVNIAMAGSDSKDGTLTCTYNNAEGQKVEVPVADVVLKQNAYITVYFKLNLSEGKVTVKVNDGTKEATALNEAEIGLTVFNYLQLSSSDSGRRTQTTKEIVICGAAKTLEDSKTEANGIIDAEIAKYDAAEYTINGAELTSAVTTAKAAVEAAQDVAGVNQAVADCKAALKAVLKDSAIEEARTNALTALTTKYPATQFIYENLTEGDAEYNNKKDYEDKITEVTEALATKNSAAEMKEITDAADTYLAGITNAKKLAAKKVAVVAALEDYATGYKTEHCDTDEKVAAVDHAVELQIAILNNSTGIADANTKLAAAKLAIEDAVADLEKDIDTVADEAINEIKAYNASRIEEIATAYDGAYADLINDVIDAAELEIIAKSEEDTTANRNAIAKIDTDTKAEIDRYLANYEAHVAADAYKAEQAATVQNTTVKAEIEALDFIEIFKEVKAYTKTEGTGEDQHEVTVTAAEAREEANAAANKQVNDIVASLATLNIAVTLDNGEVCYVTYGSKLTVSDLHVTGFNVTAATVGGVSLEEADLTVYNPVNNVVVTGKSAIEGFKVTEEWTAAADATDVANIVNNNLVSVTSKGGDTYKTGNFSVGGKPFTKWWTSLNIETNKDNSATPLVITAKASLQSLTVYVTLADSAGTGNNRHGSIFAVINDGEPVAIKTLSSKGDMSVAWTPTEPITAGDVIKIYALNKNGSGGRLHLFGVDATVDTSKIEKTVTVNWLDSDTNAAISGIETQYHYFATLTAPETNPTVAGKSFSHWSATPNGETPYTFGESLEGKTTVTVYAVFETADATVTFHDEDGTVIGSGIPAVSGKPFDTTLTPENPTKPAGEDGTKYKFVGWATRSGEEGSYTYTVVDLENYTVNGDVDLYAKFDVVTLTEVGYFAATNEDEALNTVNKGDNLVDDDLLTVTTVDLSYSVATTGKTSKDMSSGYSVTPYGKETATDLTPKAWKSTTELGKSSSDTKSLDVLTITAKEDITVKLYINLSNSSFSSDRATTLSYTLGGETKTESVGDRKNLKAVTITLKKGESVTINLTNTTSNSATVYLFGIEAQLSN